VPPQGSGPATAPSGQCGLARRDGVHPDRRGVLEGVSPRFVVYVWSRTPQPPAGRSRRRAIPASEEHGVVVVALEDPPWRAGGRHSQDRRRGVNIELAYVATDTRLVLGAVDVDKILTTGPRSETCVSESLHRDGPE
jgi:hypothetical protein